MNSRKLLILWLVLLLWYNGQIFWFDLVEEISSEFNKYFEWGYSDKYLEAPYSPKYSKDPYWDALKNVWDMSMQQKIAWVEYVEEALASRNCSLNQKQLWAILYYFVPEFRAELARNMKMELGEPSSRKFILDEDTILVYCKIYYQNCELHNNLDRRSTYESLLTGENEITASTPENIKSNCQEFFQRTYREWQANEQRVQNLQVSQLWSDKYWNATTDDSPYDIMSDLSTQAELSFKEVDTAITPVLYDLPVFSNSKQKVSDLAERNANDAAARNNRARAWWSASNNNWWSNGATRDNNVWGTSLWWSSDWWSASLWWWNNEWNTSSSDNPTPLPNSSQWFSMEWWLDYLVEWLWANSVVRNNSLFYWSLCGDEEEEPEPEEEKPVDAAPTRSATQPWRDLSNLSSKELETLVDNLEAAVDKINEKPVLKENQTVWWSTSTTSSSGSDPEADQERARQEILTCFDSCKGLRLDQKASCELMCACWERKSDIFDPEKNPGLWPIVMLRYCTVPAVDMRFTVWWKSVFSLEEMVNEIYWVVDKLSREWKLWIWTQQYNFLDSSTKMMKVADTFAFSIDIEFVDIADQLPNYSTHYRTFVAERENNKSLQNYGISNPINNPGTKNRFRVIWERGSSVKWYSTASNSDVNRQDLADLDVAPSPLVDLSGHSREERYAILSQYMHNWDVMQADFWEKSIKFIVDMTSYAKALEWKKW